MNREGALACIQLLLLKPQCGAAAKPRRWGDLYANRTSLRVVLLQI